jgi:mono/diheme cytochrome c family protein
MRNFWILAAALLAAPILQAATPEDLLQVYSRQARADVTTWSVPSVAAGRELFVRRRVDWSCSSCHTSNPGATGRHVVTGKIIAPLAPAVNAERFRDPARAEKWFKRNCNDTLGRPCTAAEKADMLAYLMTIRAET